MVAFMLAYAGSAARKAIASQQNTAGEIARSAIGGLVEKLVNAQFSQQEEREADDYGVLYLQRLGYDVQPAVFFLYFFLPEIVGSVLMLFLLRVPRRDAPTSTINIQDYKRVI